MAPDDRLPPAHRLSAALGAIAAVAWPFLVLRGHHSLLDLRDDWFTIGAEWSAVLVLAAIAFLLQRHRPSHFGLRGFGWRDLGCMLLALGVMFAVVGFLSRFTARPTAIPSPRQLAALPLFPRVVLVLTAGCCEEFLYRGFLIEELRDLTGSRALAAAVSVVAFALAHGGRYGLSSALLIPGSIGLIITLLYLWRRNLPLCMLMHATVDALSVIVVPFLVSAAGNHLPAAGV